jgi:protoporphyrinogen/coproporphyrinogen III oxidase
LSTTDEISTDERIDQQGVIKIAIIGGGISGLAAAYELERLDERQRIQIYLFEKSERLGGKIHTEHRDDLVLETGAESFLVRKPAAMEWCRELGITDQLQGTRLDSRRTFVLSGGRLHRLPEGLSGFVPSKLGPLFRSSLLSVTGKLRAACDFFIPADRRQRDESLEAFMVRRMGHEVYQKLAEPLMCGIYAGRGNELSLAATFPELRQLEQKYGSLIRGLWNRTRGKETADLTETPFKTFRHGMTTLVQAAEQRLTRTRIVKNRDVIQLARRTSGWDVYFGTGKFDSFNAIISAVPSFVLAGMINSTASNLVKHLNDIPHVSTATINLWYNAKQFDGDVHGYGFVVPTQEQQLVTAVTWTSSKHHHRAVPGKVLLRAYVGRSGLELPTELDDDSLIDRVRAELQRMMRMQAAPLGWQVTRWPLGSPQYTMGHLERLAAIDSELARLGKLYLCGASYRGVGIPDCITSGRGAARKLVAESSSLTK